MLCVKGFIGILFSAFLLERVSFFLTDWSQPAIRKRHKAFTLKFCEGGPGCILCAVYAAFAVLQAANRSPGPKPCLSNRTIPKISSLKCFSFGNNSRMLCSLLQQFLLAHHPVEPDRKLPRHGDYRAHPSSSSAQHRERVPERTVVSNHDPRHLHER